MPSGARSSTQEIEALEEEPWPEEAELELRAIEAMLYNSGAQLGRKQVEPSSIDAVGDGAVDEPRPLSQVTDLWEDMPWSSSAEAAVQQIEREFNERHDDGRPISLCLSRNATQSLTPASTHGARSSDHPI